MGSMQAQEMATWANLREGVTWHLTGNHYPPIPVSMVDPCIEAMYAYAEGDSHRRIPLPDPVKWKGQSEAPAVEIIEQHHLWDFTSQVVDGELGWDE